MRQGDFSEINRPIYDPLTGQPFPGNVIPAEPLGPRVGERPARPDPRAEHAGTPQRQSARRINNYLINPEPGAAGQPVRRQDRPQPEREQPLLRPLQLPEDPPLLPATLPHGDAGFTFGHGDGDIKAHSFAFNDTHTFNPSWLNEVRVGYSSIKFYMTSIDYGENLAEQVGIPGANINDVSSAFIQINFEQGGMRNMGSNGNQPLITNLGTLQLYDNVSHLKGRHTFKAGAA